jgi:predicted nucleic acid-binding protein
MSAKCHACDGCGQVANTADREPWTAWTSLPASSALRARAAVLLGEDAADGGDPT